MHRDTSTDTHTSTDANSGGGFGMWTEAFTELRHAATTGAPAAEVECLAAAEVAARGLVAGWDR